MSYKLALTGQQYIDLGVYARTGIRIRFDLDIPDFDISKEYRFVSSLGTDSSKRFLVRKKANTNSVEIWVYGATNYLSAHDLGNCWNVGNNIVEIFLQFTTNSPYKIIVNGVSTGVQTSVNVYTYEYDFFGSLGLLSAQFSSGVQGVSGSLHVNEITIDWWEFSTDTINGLRNRYDPSASNGTGLTLYDTHGDQDGTLIGFSGDDSQWIAEDGGGVITVSYTTEMVFSIKQQVQNLVSINSNLNMSVEKPFNLVNKLRQKISKLENITFRFYSITTALNSVSTSLKEKVISSKNVITSLSQRVVDSVNVIFTILENGAVAAVNATMSVVTSLKQLVSNNTFIDTGTLQQFNKISYISTKTNQRVVETYNIPVAMCARVNGSISIINTIRQKVEYTNYTFISFLNSVYEIKTIEFSINGEYVALTAGANFRFSVRQDSYRLVPTESRYRLTIKG